MEILFKTDKLRRLCCETRLAQKEWSKPLAEKLRRRMDELRDAETLDVMRCLPQARCEELKGNRKGQLSVRLEGGYRLIFVPAEEPIPRKLDGGLDWRNVRYIQIISIEDYHD